MAEDWGPRQFFLRDAWIQAGLTLLWAAAFAACLRAIKRLNVAHAEVTNFFAARRIAPVLLSVVAGIAIIAVCRLLIWPRV